MEIRRRRSSPPPWEITVFAMTRGVVGAIELVLAELTPRWSWSRSRFDRRSRTAVRVLGGRQLGQALLTYLAPERSERTVVLAGAAVDGIHAASMLVLAGRSTRWRGPGLIETAVAIALATFGTWIGRRRFAGYRHG